MTLEQKAKRYRKIKRAVQRVNQRRQAHYAELRRKWESELGSKA